MILGNAIYNILKDDSGVSALVGTNIYPVIIPQGIGDSIKYHIISDQPHDTKTGVSDFDKYRVRISSYSKRSDTVDSIDEAVREALDRFNGTVQSVNVDSIQYLTTEDGFDEDSQYFEKISDYYIIIKT